MKYILTVAVESLFEHSGVGMLELADDLQFAVLVALVLKNLFDGHNFAAGDVVRLMCGENYQVNHPKRPATYQLVHRVSLLLL